MQSARRIVTAVLATCFLMAAAQHAAAQQPPPAEGDEAALVAVLKSDAPLFEKAKACQRLAVVGTKAAVPVLAELLANEQLSHYARTALEPLDDPAADDALRAALDRLEGGLLVGVINSIGIRRDVKAVGQLIVLLVGSDPTVAGSAAGSLGRIATPEAIGRLKEALSGPEPLRTFAADACLTAADQLVTASKSKEASDLYDALRGADLPPHIKIAALQGAIRARGAAGLPLLVESLKSDDRAAFRVALRMAQEVSGDEVTLALIAALPALQEQAESPRAALVIRVLGLRGDKVALPIVLEAAKSGSPQTRLAAVRVLATLGDADAVPVLLAAAAAGSDDLKSAALDSLGNLSGDEVSASLASMLAESSGAKKLILIDLVGRRGIDSAVPALLSMADSEDEAIRVAAIGALGVTVGLNDLPKLVDQLVAAQSAAGIKEALSKACLRMPDRDAAAVILSARMPQASSAAKSDLLDLLGVLGGEKALRAVAAVATSGDEADQDAATRVLGKWMTPDVAPVLLQLSKSGSRSFQVRTLRGYVRIAKQFDMPLAERISMCRQTLAAAQRDDEKKLALAVLAQYPAAEALSLVVPYLDNANLKQDAAAAAVAVAEKAIDKQPAAVTAAMQKAIDATTDVDVKKRAGVLLRRAQRNSRGG